MSAILSRLSILIETKYCTSLILCTSFPFGTWLSNLHV